MLEDKSPFFTGGGVYSDFFSRNVPVFTRELVVDAAKELKLQYRTHLLPNVVVSDEEQGGVRHLKFVQSYHGSAHELGYQAGHAHHSLLR